MGWNNSGVFNPALVFTPNTPATAEDQNTQDLDFAAGITNCIARDGQAPATADIPLGGNKITGLANGTVQTDAAAFGQLGTLLPPGIVLPTAGSSVPLGYLLCNGQAVSRTTFAALFAIIGTLYGVGDGSTTFNVPNLIGRVIAGIDQTGTVLSSFSISNPGSPGGAGGTEGHVLSVAELAAHTHSVSDPGHAHGLNDPGHAHGFTEDTLFSTTVGAGGTGAFAVSGTSTGATSTNGTGVGVNIATAGIGIIANGSSNQHLNVQPTMTMFYIIKT